MTQMTLYTGNGVSLSPHYADGRTVSDYIRLIADDGMSITDGSMITTCVDTKAPDAWTDCELPPEDDELTDSEALDIMIGGTI